MAIDKEKRITIPQLSSIFLKTSRPFVSRYVSYFNHMMHMLVTYERKLFLA